MMTAQTETIVNYSQSMSEREQDMDQSHRLTVSSNDEESYRLVVKKLHAIFNTLTTSVIALREKIDDLLDDDFVRYNANGEPDGDKDSAANELVQIILTIPKYGCHVLRCRPTVPGEMEVYIRLGTADFHVIFSGQLNFTPQAKLIDSHTTRKTCTNVVDETGHKVQRIVQDRETHSTLDTPPLERIWMHHCDNLRNELLKYKHQRFSLQDSTGAAYEGGAYFEIRKSYVTNARTIVLYDRKDRPVALCQRQGHGFVVCGTQPLVENACASVKPIQEEVRFHHQLKLVTFYPWFRFEPSKHLSGPIVLVHILCTSPATGRAHFRPIYKIVPESTTNVKSQGGGKLSDRPMDKQHRVLDYYLCNAVAIIGQDVSVHPKRHVVEPFPTASTETNTGSTNQPSKHKGMFRRQKILQLDIAQGVDPIIMLCVAACLEEMGL